MAARMQGLNWNDLRYVLALARTGSFAAAAKRRLGVDATTVARRLRAAETELAALVFHRLPDGTLRPTQAGEAVLRYAEAAEAAVTDLAAAATGATAAPAGVVRITAVPILVGRVLVPASADFLRRHPALRLDLVGEPRDLSLTRREADVALRLARPTPDAGNRLLTRKLGLLAYAAYRPAAADPDVAGRLPWIGYEPGMEALPQARWLAAAARAHGGATLALNDAKAIIQAVRAGLGRSILPRVVGDSDVELRRISVPGDLPPLPSREVWLLVHPELRSLARIAAVTDWLASTVAAIEARD